MNQTKQFSLLLSIVFIGFVGISLPYTIFGPLFLQPENFTFLPVELLPKERILWLGITLSTYPLGIFIGAPILGSLSDSYGRKKILFISLLIAALANVLSGISLTASSLPILLISRLIAGISEGNIAIARAMTQDLSKEGGPSLHSGLGKVNAIASIAYLVGPLIGGLFSSQALYQGFESATPFFVIAFVAVLAAGLTAMFLKETKITTETSFSFRKLSFLRPIFRLLKKESSKQSLRQVLLCSTLFTVAVDIFYEFFPLHLAHSLSFSPLLIALVNSCLCMALAIGNGWLPQVFSKYFSNKHMIVLGSLLFSLWLFFFSFQETLLGISLFATLCGFCLSIAVVNYNVELSRHAHDDIQGEAFGVLMGMRTLADALICLIGAGFMLAASNAPLLLAVLVAFLSAFYYRAIPAEKVDISA